MATTTSAMLKCDTSATKHNLWRNQQKEPASCFIRQFFNVTHSIIEAEGVEHYA